MNPKHKARLASFIMTVGCTTLLTLPLACVNIEYVINPDPANMQGVGLRSASIVAYKAGSTQAARLEQVGLPVQERWGIWLVPDLALIEPSHHPAFSSYRHAVSFGLLPYVDFTQPDVGFAIPLWIFVLPVSSVLVRRLARKSAPHLSCLACGYSLEGIVKADCPECGRKHV